MLIRGETMNNAYIACVFVMLFTALVTVALMLFQYRQYSRSSTIETRINTLENALKHLDTEAYSMKENISLIRTKHYENLADDLLAESKKVQKISDRMDSLVETQKRYESKISQRLRRSKDIEEPSDPVNFGEPFPAFAPPSEIVETNNRKFGAWPEGLKTNEFKKQA